jgi:hypothetical protein
MEPINIVTDATELGNAPEGVTDEVLRQPAPSSPEDPWAAAVHDWIERHEAEGPAPYQMSFALFIHTKVDELVETLKAL